MMTMAKEAILLLAYGGPESLAEIEPFLKKLLRRDPLPPGLLPRVISKYEAVGGSSPLPRICREIRYALAEKSGGLPVYLGFRYAEPSIDQTVADMLADGIEQVYALSLSPHSSQISSKAYYQALDEAAAGSRLKICALENWYRETAYNQLLAQRVRESATAVGLDLTAPDCRLVFSAHNIPAAYLEQGDRYLDEIRLNLKLVQEYLPAVVGSSLAFQSKGNAPGAWLEPDIEEHLAALKTQGAAKVMVVPISFSMDHLETLYDLDLELQKTAAAIGLELHRSRPANADDDFIEMLSRFIERRRQAP